MRRKETGMQVLEYFFLTRFLKIYNIFLYNKINLNLFLFSFSIRALYSSCKKKSQIPISPPEKVIFKMPSLIRVKFPCVFTNIEQKFNIYRLDQLEMELPMKTHACKILSVGVLQMHKGHLKFFLQSLYVFNVQCFQLQCVNEIPFFLPVTFIIPDVIVLFNLPRLYFIHWSLLSRPLTIQTTVGKRKIIPNTPHHFY